MTDNLSHRKYQLIQEIIRIQNEQLIDALEREIRASHTHKVKSWSSIIRSPKSSLSLQDMITEQEYKPLTSESFFEAADAIGIKESIDDLLSMLD